MTTHSEREAFENAYMDEHFTGCSPVDDFMRKHPNGKYENPVQHAMWWAWQARASVTPPHPTEVGETVAWMATHPGIGDVVLFTKFPSEYETKGIAVTPLYTHPAPAAVDGDAHAEAEQFIQAEIDRAPEPLRRLGEFLSRVLDEDQWATANAMLLGIATANSAEGKVDHFAVHMEPTSMTGTVIKPYAVPDGYALVPVEPTEAMLEATSKVVAGTLVSKSIRTAIYKAMLNATASTSRGS